MAEKTKVEDDFWVTGSASIGKSPQDGHSPFSHLHSSFHTLKQRFKFIFENELYCDVAFICGGDPFKKLKANKWVLAVRSPVFHDIFQKNWRECCVIEVPDVEYDVFRELLRFLFSDEASVTADNAVALMYAAKKYAAIGLEILCTEWIEKNLRADTAFSILSQARSFNNQCLVDSCLKVIDDFTNLAIQAAGFCAVDNATLCVVLARDSLRIKEIDLFEAIVRWSKAECGRQNSAETADNLKLVLKGALSLIRFPVMSQEEFANKVADTALLSEAEQLSILLYFIKNPKPTISFNTSRRLYDSLVLNRFEDTESGWPCDGSSHALRFTVNRTAQLIGLGLFGSENEGAEYAVNISVLCDEGYDPCVVLNEYSVTHKPKDQEKIFRIYFERQVDLKPHLNYIIKFSMKGPDSFYGLRGQEDVSQQYPDGRSVTISFYTRGAKHNFKTNYAQGQMPELLLKLPAS